MDKIGFFSESDFCYTVTEYPFYFDNSFYHQEPNLSLSNREIADIFERCADMLQIRGDNIHRVLSYRRAAETIRALPRDLRAISREGGLTQLTYIGKTIAAKIDEMLDTGELDFYNRLKAEIPEGLVDIMRVNGVGPKKSEALLGTA